jgi:hypothetical protein
VLHAHASQRKRRKAEPQTSAARAGRAAQAETHASAARADVQACACVRVCVRACAEWEGMPACRGGRGACRLAAAAVRVATSCSRSAATRCTQLDCITGPARRLVTVGDGCTPSSIDASRAAALGKRTRGVPWACSGLATAGASAVPADPMGRRAPGGRAPAQAAITKLCRVGLHDSSRSLQAGIPSNCQRSSEISTACAATVALSKAFAASSAAIRWCSAAQDAESVCELMPAPVTCTICFQRWTHQSRPKQGYSRKAGPTD